MNRRIVMALGENLTLFREIEIFGLLEPDALKLLAFSAEARSFRPGETIVLQDEDAGGAFLLSQGAVVLSGNDMSAQLRNRQRAPSLISELALIAPIRQWETASAEGSVKLFFISRPLFQRILLEYPASAAKVANAIAARLEIITQDMIATLGRMSRAPALAQTKGAGRDAFLLSA